MIPEFRNDGSLPPGIHTTTWQEFSDRFGYNLRRQRLLAGLRAALIDLRNAGCRIAYIDGSFITDKEFPNDYDGCWDPTGIDMDVLDPVLYEFAERRKSQKDKYFGEMFPMSWLANIEGETFLEFFQKNIGGDPKGIVLIELAEMK